MMMKNPGTVIGFVVPLVCMAVAMADVEPKNMYQWTFEDGDAQGLWLDGAALDAEQQAVVADTRGKGVQWNEYLRTLPEVVPLRARHMYQVEYDYRVLSGVETTHYCLMRSWSQIENGGDLDQHHFLDPLGDGVNGRVHHRFSLPKRDDFHFIIGAVTDAHVAVDNLIILDLGPLYDDGAPIAPIATGVPAPYEEQLAWVRAFRREHAIPERMRDYLVLICNEGAGAKVQRDKVLADLQPDYVDWNPAAIGPLGREFGIGTSIGGAEYQEFYRVESPPELWEKRHEYFGEEGFIRRADGAVPPAPHLWAEGGYGMCLNADRWHRFQQQTMIDRLETYEDICQDNISWGANFHMGGCWCDACESKFRAHLARRYDRVALARMGIYDLETFTFADYMNRESTLGWRARTNAVSREWILFQNQSTLGAWVDSVVKIKQRGLELGRPVAVYGNQIALHRSPYVVSLSPFCDVIEVENEDQPFTYLIGRGVAADGQPVWTRGAYAHPTQYRMPDNSLETWSRQFGLGLTFGGLRVISLGWNAPWTGDPNIPDPIEVPETYDLFQRYSAFLRANRAALGPQDSYTRIAVLYSVPTIMWHNFPPLGLETYEPMKAWGEIPNLLLEQRIPFDVIVLGHPELWDDGEDLKRLEKYDAIIAPHIECLSATQAQVLTQRVQAGATLFVQGAFGTADENLNPRPDWPGRAPAHQAVTDVDALPNALRRHHPLEVAAEGRLFATAFVSQAGPFMTIHLWNPEPLETPDGVSSVVRVQLPPHITPELLELRSFDHEPVTLQPVRGGAPDELGQPAAPPGELVLTVPPVRYHGMLVIGAAEAIDAAQREAEDRLAADRERIKGWWQ